MKQLEADQLAEESRLGNTNGEHHAAGVNGNTSSAPTTPPGHEGEGQTNGSTKEAVAPIGQGREMANGAKSMPASRRASGYGTFGLEKLSLSVMDEGTGRTNWDEEEVNDQGAHSECGHHIASERDTDLDLDSVKYVVGDDESFPVPKEGGKRLSAASAALDLAPLSQTPPRAFGQRPFETGLKTSDWPNFQAAPHRGLTSPLPAQPSSLEAQDSATVAGRKTSPTGMADSIASLPALPSKTVPATPFGYGGMGANGGGPRTRTPNAQDTLSQAQRGYSNPDLARTFGKSGGFSALDNGAPRVRRDRNLCQYDMFIADICSRTTPILFTRCTPQTALLCPQLLLSLLRSLPTSALTHTASTMMDTALVPCTLVAPLA